jgi:hypothetical protein
VVGVTFFSVVGVVAGVRGVVVTVVRGVVVVTGSRRSVVVVAGSVVAGSVVAGSSLVVVEGVVVGTVGTVVTEWAALAA